MIDSENSLLIVNAKNDRKDYFRLLLDNNVDVDDNIDNYAPDSGRDHDDCWPMIRLEMRKRKKRAVWSMVITYSTYNVVM